MDENQLKELARLLGEQGNVNQEEPAVNPKLIRAMGEQGVISDADKLAYGSFYQGPTPTTKQRVWHEGIDNLENIIKQQDRDLNDRKFDTPKDIQKFQLLKKLLEG